MSLAKFSVNNKVVVTLCMCAVFIVGIYTIYIIPKESRPAVDFGNALITVSYPGVSPEEIEYQIIKKIEEQILNLTDVDYYTSIAQEGSASIRIFFDAKANSDDCFDKLVTEIAKVTDLPPDAGDPVLLQMKMRELSEMADIALTGDFSPNSIRDIAEDLQEKLLNIDYMSKVEVHGTQKREVHVNVDMNVMNQIGITFSDLNSLIQNRNMNIPGGSVNFGLAEFIVRTMGEFATVHELGQVIIRADAQGRVIRLEEFADIDDGLEEQKIITKLDGKKSVTLQVYKKEEGNIISVMKEVRKVVADFEKSVPGLTATIRNDESIDVATNIQKLSNSAIQGIILVFLVLWIFIGYKSSILVSIGIPFSFTMTIWLMNYLDITINNMSLFGLVLVLGMIVDNSIVVIENVWRHLEAGFSVTEAVIKGTNEVITPLIAAVLTIMASFLPILMTQGRIGRFIGPFPIIVSIAVIASLIQALFILPTFIDQFVKLQPHKRQQKKETHFYKKFQARYKRLLFFILQHRGKAVLTVVIALITCLFALLAGPVRFDFFPRRPAPSLTLKIKTPVGTNLDHTSAIIAQIENFMMTMPESEDITAIVSTIGQMRENRQWKRATSNAELRIELADTEVRKHTVPDIRNRIREFLSDLPGVYTYSFDETRGGPPVGLDMELRIRGEDLHRLEYIAKYIEEEVHKFPGVTDIDNSFSPGKEELKLHPIYANLAMYGITVAQVANTVRTAVNGSTVTQYRGSGIDEYDVILRAKEEQIITFEDLKHLKIRTASGQLIQLDDLVMFEATRGFADIQHYDGKRCITITANAGTYIDKQGKRRTRTSQEINEYLFGNNIHGTIGVLSNFSQRFPGYTLDSGGMAEDQRNSYISLFKALFIALISVYSILATQFKSYLKPLIIMLTIPFAFIGVTVGLLALHLPFSLNTFIAVVALSGIVVTNSLILIDFIEKQREAGQQRWQSIINGGSLRLRAILLTSITTISGFLPLILSQAEANQDWKPMAVAMSFGLAFATTLTLLIIPCVYSYLDSIKQKLGYQDFNGHLELHEIDLDQLS